MTTGVAIVASPPCQVRHLSSQAPVWPGVPQAAAQMDVKYWLVNMSNPALHRREHFIFVLSCGNHLVL